MKLPSLFCTVALNLFFVVKINGQSYKTMLGDSTTWYVNYYFVIYNTDYYWAAEDTLMDGKEYKIMNGFHYNRNCYLREDTLQKHIYYRQKKGFRANQDILIYDFSMEVGDSILIFDPNSTLPDSSGYFYLDSIVLTSLTADSRRVFYLSSEDGNKSAKWIEGIGSTGLVNSSSGMADSTFELTCYFKDGIRFYGSSLFTLYGSCEIEDFLSSGDVLDSKELLVFPNPARNEIHILTNGESYNTLTIFNVSGSLIKTLQLNYKEQIIDLYTFPKGLYIFRFSGIKERDMNLKVLKTD